MDKLVRLFILSGALAFALICFCSETWAQVGSTIASIDGVVADEQEGVIGGAKVIATETKTNTTVETTSGEAGDFHFLSLKPGIYEVKIEADGFKPLLAKIELLLGTQAKLKLNLKIVAADTETIIVQANSSALNTDKTESSVNIDSARIDNLPINRRNFLDFTLTTPRATDDRAAASTGLTSSSGISFNGQSARLNNVTIDGLDNNNLVAGAVRTTFSQEAVQEYQVVSDSYSAEFGKALGGVINIVTKGGTNDTHGNLFFINRNDNLSARNAFSSINPPFSQYQFGATIGGAIKKDKVFYFGSFERLTIKQNNIVTISDQLVKAARAQGYQLNNGPVPFSIGNTSVLGRIDAQLSPVDRFSFRYNFGGIYDGNFEPFGGQIAETTASRERATDNSVAFNNTYISSRYNLVNETRVLFNRRRFKELPSEEKPMVMFIGSNEAATFGRSTTGDVDYREKSINLVDNVSLTRGRNLIKFGVDYDYHTMPASLFGFSRGLALFLPIDFATINQNPNFPVLSALEAFDPASRSDAIKGFLNIVSALAPTLFPGFPANQDLANSPLPTIFQQGFGNSRDDFSQYSFATYGQDEIKVKPNLLVKLGLRYDISRAKFAPDNNGNFSPRVSLAYQPIRNLNIRAAYGIFFGTLRTGYIFAAQPTQSQNFNYQYLPFPFGVIPYNMPDHHFPITTGTGQLPPGLNFTPNLRVQFKVDPDLKNSYSQQATLGIDYAVNNNAIVGVNYNYVRGIRLLLEYQSNPIVRFNPQAPTDSFINGRLNPTEGEVTTFASIGDSYYHALTFTYNQRIQDRFTLLATYTLSKAIDNAVDFRTDLADGAVDPFNLRGERALSVQDVRQRFIVSGLYKLPNARNVFLRDFQVSSIVTVESGHPYNLRAGADLNQNGDLPPFDRPIVNNVQIGRNLGVLPGFARVDARLTRFINIKEKYRVELFAEVFNLFNRVNIKSINRFFSPDAMGNFNLPARSGQNGRFIAPPERYIEAFSPRQFQLGFRLNF